MLSLLVKRYHKEFCSYAFWYTGNIDMAQDIVQDSWTAIIRNLYRLKKPDSFKSWAMRIITRKAQDHLSALSRKRRLEKAIRPDIIVENVSVTESEDQWQVLKKAIRNLTREHRLVLRLFYIEQYSLKEISEILDISTGTVKSRLYHAREKLKSLIK